MPGRHMHLHCCCTDCYTCVLSIVLWIPVTPSCLDLMYSTAETGLPKSVTCQTMLSPQCNQPQSGVYSCHNDRTELFVMVKVLLGTQLMFFGLRWEAGPVMKHRQT